MTSGVFHAVSVNEISIDRDNRIRRNLDGVEALADSIQRLGLIHPIVISRDNLLIAGERRLTAVRSLGWTHINAQYIDEIDPDDWEDIELEENIKRLDIEWQERHRALMRIHEKHKAKDPKWRDTDTAAISGDKKKDVVSQHRTVDRFITNERVKNAKTFNEAHQIATKLAERHDADLMYIPDLGEYTQSPIMHADFHSWSETYDGPKFNFIHCDFPYGINSHLSEQNRSGYSEDRPEITSNLIR
jgi:ParB family chromosome partitioning protein